MSSAAYVMVIKNSNGLCPSCRIQEKVKPCKCTSFHLVSPYDTRVGNATPWLRQTIHGLDTITCVVMDPLTSCIYIAGNYNGWGHILRVYRSPACLARLQSVPSIALWPPGLASICIAYVLGHADWGCAIEYVCGVKERYIEWHYFMEIDEFKEWPPGLLTVVESYCDKKQLRGHSQSDRAIVGMVLDPPHRSLLYILGESIVRVPLDNPILPVLEATSKELYDYGEGAPAYYYPIRFLGITQGADGTVYTLINGTRGNHRVVSWTHDWNGTLIACHGHLDDAQRILADPTIPDQIYVQIGDDNDDWATRLVMLHPRARRVYPISIDEDSYTLSSGSLPAKKVSRRDRKEEEPDVGAIYAFGTDARGERLVVVRDATLDIHLYSTVTGVGKRIGRVTGFNFVRYEHFNVAGIIEQAHPILILFDQTTIYHSMLPTDSPRPPPPPAAANKSRVRKASVPSDDKKNKKKHKT